MRPYRAWGVVAVGHVSNCQTHGRRSSPDRWRRTDDKEVEATLLVAKSLDLAQVQLRQGGQRVTPPVRWRLPSRTPLVGDRGHRKDPRARVS
jgi:hypothetical protein